MSLLVRVRSALGFTVGLVSLVAPPLSAQQGTITGRITDAASGQPLGDVRVQVTGTSLSASTNPQGTYTIRVSPATYQVRAVRIGFASESRNVTVGAGETVTADLALK